MCKKAIEAAGGKFTGMFDHYCGPYRVKEWGQKQSYSLELNPNWNGPKPHITDVKFVIIDDISFGEFKKDFNNIDSKYVEFIEGKFQGKSQKLFDTYGPFDFVWFDCGGPEEYIQFMWEYWDICS